MLIKSPDGWRYLKLYHLPSLPPIWYSGNVEVQKLRDEKNPCFLFKSNSTDTWCLRFLAKNRRHQVSPGMVFLKSQIDLMKFNYKV